MQEFLNVALSRFRKLMTIGSAQAYMERVLLPLCEIFPDARLFRDALSIKEETGWRFYDALIVSSAIMAGCAVLLTEDLQDDHVLRGLEARSPF